MASKPKRVLIYHITDISNLPGILADGGLHSDAVMVGRDPTIIGHDHIKKRRLHQIQVPCCGGRYVGEFVPFYYCPRSPMLYVVNQGRTTRPAGCQTSIVHLVSAVDVAVTLGAAWAVSDGNAGAFHTSFFSTLKALDTLDWSAIEAKYWNAVTHQKQAEFLVADFFPWTGILAIGVMDDATKAQAEAKLPAHTHTPTEGIRAAGLVLLSHDRTYSRQLVGSAGRGARQHREHQGRHGARYRAAVQAGIPCDVP